MTVVNGSEATPTPPPDRPSGVVRKPRRVRKKRFVVVYAKPGIMKDPIFAFESAPDDLLKVFELVIPAAYRKDCRVVPEREWLEVEAERKRDAERLRRSLSEMVLAGTRVAP